MHEELFEAINNVAYLAFSSEESEVIRRLRSVLRPTSIWVGDGFRQKEHARLLHLIKLYVAEKGLNIMFGSAFPTLVRPEDLEWIFAVFGKSWNPGTYQRDDISINSATKPDDKEDSPGESPKSGTQELLRRSTLEFEESYSMNALRLRGIIMEDIVYLSKKLKDDLTVVAESELEAPILFSRVGKGWLGYIGDVNAEESCEDIILAMIGIDPSLTLSPET
jgi:hypothetical protein